MKEIMLFPLSSIVLPQGKMKLRIFEPRYKRMVAESSKNGHEFGICLISIKSCGNSSCLSKFGTLVRVVDFDMLSDGLLGITVIGLKRFMIHSVRSEDDGLRFAQVSWLPDWPNCEFSQPQQFLGIRLRAVYQQIPQIGDLYSQCCFDDATWVSQRWLELLPLSVDFMDRVVSQPDCQSALNFLLGFITGDEKEKPE